MIKNCFIYILSMTKYMIQKVIHVGDIIIKKKTSLFSFTHLLVIMATAACNYGKEREQA